MKYLLAFLLSVATASACELLVKAGDSTHANPTEDARGSYKRGMVVVVKPDGHVWGGEERLPKFVVIKIPLISVARAEKYLNAHVSGETTLRRRLWRIRWEDLPQLDRDKLRDTGQLVIKATDLYTGPFDRTWLQVRTFFRNLQTNADETEDL